MQIINLKELDYLFDIDDEAGTVTWRNPPKNHRGLDNKTAGGNQFGGGHKFYHLIQVKGRKYRRGRLIYFHHTGFWPPLIDHINGNSLDDRIANLRAATRLQNSQNRKIGNTYRKLPMGVRCSNTTSDGVKSYDARITVNRVPVHLGSFKSLEEAEHAYKTARKEYFGDYS